MGNSRKSTLQKEEIEPSIKKAMVMKKIAYFSKKQDFNKFLEKSEEPYKLKNNLPYIVNQKNAYFITGSFWARTPNLAIKEFLKELNGISILNEYNISEQTLKLVEQNKFEHNSSLFNYKIVSKEHTTGDIVIKEEKGTTTKIRDATRWQIEFIIQKPKRK